MIVVCERPPMFGEIDAKFNVAGRPVIFAWGDTIYNPEAIVIGPELHAHEAVHGERQGNDIEGWWHRYLDDPAFRLAEEIPAHRAELCVLLANARHRNDRRFFVKNTAKRLASPLYGGLITPERAKAILRAAA